MIVYLIINKSTGIIIDAHLNEDKCKERTHEFNKKEKEYFYFYINVIE